MGYGRWTRAGRGGSFELYSLELGNIVRCEVRATHTVLEKAKWHAVIGVRTLGSFDTFEEATAEVARQLKDNEMKVIADWAIFKAEKPPKRRLTRY